MSCGPQKVSQDNAGMLSINIAHAHQPPIALAQDIDNKVDGGGYRCGWSGTLK